MNKKSIPLRGSKVHTRSSDILNATLRDKGVELSFANESKMKISTLLEITLLFEQMFCYNMNTLLVGKTLLTKLGE